MKVYCIFYVVFVFIICTSSSSSSSSLLSVLACTIGYIWYHCSLCAEVTSKKLTSVTFISND